ncbi:hypothetical protein ABWH96_18495 [Marivirga tractuosa]|uniref:hypothetical protein n=1 Tax=Marivirga tractuosa TaxID=1006 RepID=UPI0035CEC961
MKRLFILVLVFAVSALGAERVSAQGGFGGVHAASEFTSNGNLLMIGGGGAWVINSNFYIGGAGYGSANSVYSVSGELNSLGYGGFMFGYFNEVKESIRVGGDVLTGSGGYAMDDVEEDFFFIEPNVKVWYSINKIMHLSAGLYYRIAYLNADAVLNEQDLNNFGIKLSLNFGKL